MFEPRHRAATDGCDAAPIYLVVAGSADAAVTWESKESRLSSTTPKDLVSVVMGRDELATITTFTERVGLS